MLKAEASPLSRDAPNRRADAVDYRRPARRRFVASMRRRIDMAEFYADARGRAGNDGRTAAATDPDRTANTDQLLTRTNC